MNRLKQPKSLYSYSVIISFFYTICICLLLLSSTGYQPEQSTSEKPIYLLDAWRVVSDGILEAESATLPYVVEHEDADIITIQHVLPQTNYRNTALSLSVFQKNIRIFVEDTLIYERIYQPRNPIQKSPGSGKILVLLPDDAAGKTLSIEYEQVVKNDNGPISDIKLEDATLTTMTMRTNNVILLMIISALTMVAVVALLSTMLFRSLTLNIDSVFLIGIFLTCTSTWVMCNSKLIQIFTDNWVLIHNMEYLSFFIIPIPLLLFTKRTWKLRHKLLVFNIRCAVLFLGIVLISKLVGIADYFVFLPYYHFFAIFTGIVFTYVLAVQWKSMPDSLRVFSLGFILLALSTIVDLIRYYTIFTSNATADFYILGLLGMGICLVLSMLLVAKESLTEQFKDKMYKVLAFSDLLTGLQNRNAFQMKLQKLSNQNEQNVTILVADADDLKTINDTLGHTIGDEMLVTMAHTLKDCFGNFGKVYRIGGDEFVVIFQYTTIEKIEQEVQNFYQQLEQKATSYPLRISLSYATFDPSRHHSFEDVFKEADDAMYLVKREGKKRRNSQQAT